jgi:hypothetical protein
MVVRCIGIMFSVTIISLRSPFPSAGKIVVKLATGRTVSPLLKRIPVILKHSLHGKNSWHILER